MKSRTASCIVLTLLALAAGPTPAAAEEDDSPRGSITVHCEVWRAWGAALVEEIEAMSERDPSDAAAVRTALQGTRDGAERLARFLTPMAADSDLSLQATHQTPQGVTTTSTGGAVTAGFAGFTESGTTLQVRCRLADAGVILTDLSLRVSGTVPVPAGGSAMPPSRYKADLTSTLSAASGEMLMVQSNTKDADTLYMFFKATRN